MTQPAWQKRARDLLPECLPPHQKAVSLHDFLLDLVEVLRSAAPAPDLRQRIWTFADYCLDPDRNSSVRIDSLEGFVRQCVADPHLHGEFMDRLYGRSTVVFDLIHDFLPPEIVAPFASAAAGRPEWGGFEAVWGSLSRSREQHGDRPAPLLRPLLKRLRDSFDAPHPNLGEIKASLLAVLSFLGSSEGRTDANCATVDSFLAMYEPTHRSWTELPQSFVNVLGDMAGGLHDTFTAPHIALNFSSTPEQLLARALPLNVTPSAF